MPGSCLAPAGADGALLVADTAFLPTDFLHQHSVVSVFPRSPGDGAYRATLDGLVKRSRQQSSFYDEITALVTATLRPFMTAAGDQARYFVRPMIVNATSMVLDRSIRVCHRLGQLPGRRASVLAVEPIRDVRQLTDLGQTWRLNQDLIQRIGAALGCSSVELLAAREYPEYPAEYPQQNLLFVPQRTGGARLATLALSRAHGLLRRLSVGATPFVSLGFGPDEFHLTQQGLIGPLGSIREIARLDLETPPPDLEQRREIARLVHGVSAAAFGRLLKTSIDLDDGEAAELSTVFAAVLADWFPTSFLEGLAANLSKFKDALPRRAIAVIGHDATTARGYFATAAARLAGMRVIAVQHGGHYGYTADMSIAGQLEYSHCDRLVTWGWTRIDDHLPKCQTVPLPGPKLSERPLRMSRPSERDADAADVLFLSNLWHRFPHSSTCGQARVDFIDDITQSQEELMGAIASTGASISHKPYSLKFVDLYPDHYARLAAAGGRCYRLLKSDQKGLNERLLRSARILLWDQIGSGTLECLTADVPSLVYWRRIYSQEVPWARPLLAELERCGVVHTHPARLAASLGEYLKDPEAWMADRERREAIAAFCREYARTDPRWPAIWRRQLQEWAQATVPVAPSAESRQECT